MAITRYTNDANGFDPHQIQSMSVALEEVCQILRLPDDNNFRAVVANRIIDLARRGERNSDALRDRVLREANGGRII
jgi:hypothetical protein